jgi:hypothetical protein
MAHAQGPLLIEPRRVHGRWVNYFRVGCVCGRYRGGWEFSPGFAFKLHAHHAAIEER